MLPFILAAAGGYLIGDSLKKNDTTKFAEGGTIGDDLKKFVKSLPSNTPTIINHFIYKFGEDGIVDALDSIIESGETNIKSKEEHKKIMDIIEDNYLDFNKLLNDRFKNKIRFSDGGYMAKGGIFSSNRNLVRDRMFKSQQKWEQDYKRKSKPKNRRYMEYGGMMESKKMKEINDNDKRYSSYYGHTIMSVKNGGVYVNKIKNAIDGTPAKKEDWTEEFKNTNEAINYIDNILYNY